MMKVLEHEHPLKLIDLQQVKNEDVEESEEEDEEKDLVPQNEFSCICKRCDEVINEYYRVCNRSFDPYMENLWIYKCEKCIYYVHLDCATSTSTSGGQNVKNFEDVDYPNLLRLPFPDQTYSIPKHFLFKEPGPTTYVTAEVSLQHFNHEHELILVDTESIGSTSNESIMCHNPMKKIQLLCNACVRPITETPFYKCNASEDERCNFALHEWCTRLPIEVADHPGHPQHTLFLMPKAPCGFLNIYDCRVCDLPCNGYAYGCDICRFYIDVNCGFIPEKITHESHPNHLLSIERYNWDVRRCLLCSYLMRFRLSFGCSTCNVHIHPVCALLVPRTIRHPYDKHPMHLSYLPIENHKSEYFCEICELELNPHNCFYHCDTCSQSVHIECAPLILQSETETHSEYQYSYKSRAYWFSNVKLGSIHKTPNHPHPLLFAEGTANDGECSVCSGELDEQIILRCLDCRFAIHEYCFKHDDDQYMFRSTVYVFSNVKFGSIHKTANHPHPLLLAQGIANDGECSVCSEELRYEIILRCLECPFAIHERCFKNS
ncbi:putative chromatin regulator PHD family [Helianthus annuus]|nr:putative chromatin regulator PHD family [Helianthus annuus]